MSRATVVWEEALATRAVRGMAVGFVESKVTGKVGGALDAGVGVTEPLRVP